MLVTFVWGGVVWGFGFNSNSKGFGAGCYWCGFWVIATQKDLGIVAIVWGEVLRPWLGFGSRDARVL